jgi:hypothetical protein
MGMTEVVRLFYEPEKNDPELPLRHLTRGTIDDATFYSEADRDEIISQWPAHEQQARIHGMPAMGEGLIFPVPDEQIIITPFPLPDHFRRIAGLDIGVAHPTAAVWIAYDPDTDRIYIYDTYRQIDPLVSVHAAAINLRDKRRMIPVAWPHDALKSGGSGTNFADLYGAHSVRMLPESARYRDDKGGPQKVEPIIADVLERMRTGRLKVFSTQRDWLKEKANYHRKDGKPVSYMDDLMKATFYAIMYKRKARPNIAAPSQQVAQSDYDPLA